MVMPRHSKGVGPGPGAGGEGEAAGAAMAIVKSPACHQPRLCVIMLSLWHVGQRACCPVLSDQLHSGIATSNVATSDYNSFVIPCNSCNNIEGQPMVTLGHLRVTIGHLMVSLGYLRVTICHLRVTIGHLTVTMGWVIVG